MDKNYENILMILKNNIAKELKSHPVGSQEYKEADIKYKAIKG